MLARAYRDLEPFDQAVNHLKGYFNRLQRDHAESEALATEKNFRKIMGYRDQLYIASC